MHQPLVAIKSKRMPMLKVMALSLVCHAYQLIVVSFWFHFPERLKKGWRSAVYGFFKSDVKVGYDGQRKLHYFLCAAKKCKGKGGVRRFQDSKDHAATSNLRSHAIKCFGQDAVDSAFSNTQSRGRDTSIFAAFARQGQRPVKVSHHAHTKAESRWVSCWTWVFRMLSHSFVVPILWCAKSNGPLHIVKDPQFEILMKAGRPMTYIPSSSMVSRDIKLVFEILCQCIDKILTVSLSLLTTLLCFIHDL